MTCLGERGRADTYGAGGAHRGPVPLCLSVSGASHRVIVVTLNAPFCPAAQGHKNFTVQCA